LESPSVLEVEALKAEAGDIAPPTRPNPLLKSSSRRFMGNYLLIGHIHLWSQKDTKLVVEERL
jgi:hypothetical protein